MRLPNNRFSMFPLFLLFMTGVALIVIPMISQQQEISADDNIYALLAEEIQAQAAATPEPSLAPEADQQEETEPEPDETEPSEDPPVAELAETEDVVVATEEPASEYYVVEPVQPAETPMESVPETGTEQPAEQTTPETTPGLQTNQPSRKPESATATPKPSAKPQNAATENKDYVAWLSIPGTVINYPVVRSDRTEYYLHHLITGQQSKLGTLFSLTTSDYETPSKNIAIYGHHLSNSTAMFSTLLQYKNESYWKSHQTIQLKTIYGTRNYRIFAVLNHTVSDWDASTASFKDDNAFLKFVNRARKKAFYDTGIELSETDHIITLITCDRSFGGVQGRLLVMGVEQ